MHKLVATVLFVLLCMVLPLLSNANTDEPDNFDSAKKMYDAGKYVEAIPLFQKAHNFIENKQIFGQPMKYEDSEKLTAIQIYLGKSFKILKDYERAFAEFKVVGGRLDGTNSCASYLAGEMYYLQGQRKSSAKVWLHTINHSTDIDYLLYAYVMHYITMKKDVSPEKLPWRLVDDKLLRLIIEFWDGKIAEESLIKEAMTAPQNVFVNYIIGKKNLVAGRRQIANRYFKQVIQSDCYDCVGYDLARNELNISQ